MLSKKLRNNAIVMIRENRRIAKEIGDSDVISTCPFSWACHVICAEIFPKWWNKNRQFYRIDRYLGWAPDEYHCPCDKMGKHYVKRRIKKLFPELYRGVKNDE